MARFEVVIHDLNTPQRGECLQLHGNMLEIQDEHGKVLVQAQLEGCERTIKIIDGPPVRKDEQAPVAKE